MVFVDRGLQLEDLRKSKVETFNLELGFRVESEADNIIHENMGI